MIISAIVEKGHDVRNSSQREGISFEECPCKLPMVGRLSAHHVPPNAPSSFTKHSFWNSRRAQGPHWLKLILLSSTGPSPPRRAATPPTNSPTPIGLSCDDKPQIERRDEDGGGGSTPSLGCNLGVSSIRPPPEGLGGGGKPWDLVGLGPGGGGGVGTGQELTRGKFPSLRHVRPSPRTAACWRRRDWRTPEASKPPTIAALAERGANRLFNRHSRRRP